RRGPRDQRRRVRRVHVGRRAEVLDGRHEHRDRRAVGELEEVERRALAHRRHHAASDHDLDAELLGVAGEVAELDALAGGIDRADRLARRPVRDDAELRRARRPPAAAARVHERHARRGLAAGGQARRDHEQERAPGVHDAHDTLPYRMTELPTTFGKYFLTELLATGGMAEIYLAKLLGPGGFEKPLVIKQIHPKLSGQRPFVDLFVAEAKTLVTLAHSNIVPVYELGVIDDTYFIAMEYIDGPSLYRFTEALARRDVRMEPAIAAWIAARILEGLDYAHHKGEGVIHRDLSPRNVMLSRDGEVKLVDFGIAVTLGAAGEGDDARSAPTGSFPYMSPEQVRREALSAQTDLFSVGVLMWEMLAGQRRFARADADATLHAVTEDDIPRPSSVSPAVPAKLDGVVMRALARD